MVSRAEKRANERRKAAGIALPPTAPKKPKDNRREVAIGRPVDPKWMADHKIDAPAAACIEPTAERLAKEDRPIRMASHAYRSPPPIERLRDRGSLDHSAHMNEAMYQEAIELQRLHRVAGLAGIGAQDLSKVFGGDGHPAYMMPATLVAASARQNFVRRCNLMGWHALQPLRGAGRVTFAVVCEEMSLADAGRLHCGIRETERAAAVAKDRLREGLMALVDLSRDKTRSVGNAVLGRPNEAAEPVLTGP